MKPEKVKNVILRNLSDEDSEKVRELQIATGEQTASKAVLAAVHGFLEYKAKYEAAEVRANEFEERCRDLIRLNKTINLSLSSISYHEAEIGIGHIKQNKESK